MTVSFDLDALLGLIRGRRLAVACTPAGWLPEGGLLADALLARGATVQCFLALEHGLRGELQDGVQVASYVDARSGCRVHSFYGPTRAKAAECLQDVEVLLFHAQDVSHRAYTFHGAMAELMSAAAAAKIRMFVLDRPSPLAHLGIDGPLWPQFFPQPLPVLLGVTLGELALWHRHRSGLDLDLTVIPVQGWSRALPWPQPGLPWIPPSPNIPTLDSAYAYACAGVIQATSVSEGRGTCKPFEYFGAPFVDAQRLTAALTRRALPGVLFREVHFQPGFNKFAGQVCGGTHLIVRDPLALQPMRTMLAILQELARLYPGDFTLAPRFGHWLDGKEWTPEGLATLELDAYLAASHAVAAVFRVGIAPFLRY